jgi:hypothetical protein
VVDSDYRGEVAVVLFNHSDVAQLVVELIWIGPVVEVTGDGLEDTERGCRGFGSTGDGRGILTIMEGRDWSGREKHSFETPSQQESGICLV